MRIIKKAGCLIVLNVLLWVYSETMLGLKNDFTELIYSWAIDFEGFNAACIHWIAMRISIWLYVLWKMLWLEQSFMLYLFIRERNYNKMFIRQYGKCVISALIYFGTQILIFAVLFCQKGGSFDHIMQCLLQKDLWRIFINQTAGALNLCLLIYFLYCITRKAEISFMIVLGARLLLGFAVGSMQEYMHISWVPNLILNIVLLSAAVHFAGSKFYDRVQGEA